MNFRIICVFFTMIVVQVYCHSYQEAFQSALKEVGLQNDEPLKMFMKEGKFASEDETQKYKCFFNSLVSKLELSDNEGNLNGPKIKELAKNNPSETELAVFASDAAQSSCIPLPASFNSPTPCDKVYNFVLCAMASQQKPTVN